MALGLPGDLPRVDDLTTAHPWVLKLLLPLGTSAFKRWWRIRLHGLGNVPTSGPVILAPNHIGVLDGPLLGWMSPRTAFTVAKAELFRGALGRALLLTGQVPVDRRIPSPGAIRRCLRILHDGQVLIIYPEGVRGSGDFARARGGIAYLAAVTGAPIVPVALLGSRAPGATISEIPRRGTSMHVVFGEPFHLQTQPWPRRRSDVAGWTEQIRVILARHVQQATELTGMPLPGPPRPPHVSA